MCTVTFVARKHGFALGMNRDEKRTRTPALPPEMIRQHGRQIIRPREPGGGAWIAVNDTGVVFALINWYAAPAPPLKMAVSRGAVVNAVGGLTRPGSAEENLRELPLPQINPFRLIGFFPADKIVREWRWDGSTLVARAYGWETNIWISSGHDEAGAQKSRWEVFAAARRQISAGTLPWLRRLHGSHQAGPSAYSVCMHRDDAVTVSYTEVLVDPKGPRMRYFAGSPCASSAPVTVGFAHSRRFAA